jgi:hypothetical protein
MVEQHGLGTSFAFTPTLARLRAVGYFGKSTMSPTGRHGANSPLQESALMRVSRSGIIGCHYRPIQQGG